MTDTDGHCPDCIWDAINVGIGVASLVDNIRQGNYGSAVIDGIGVVVDVVATAVPLVPGGAGSIIKVARGADKVADVARVAGKADDVADVAKGATNIGEAVGDLRKAGKKDAHHIIQDAAVRDKPGYNTNAAPGIQLPGPANKPGTPHYKATQVQQQRGGGTYGAERRIGYKALRRAGVSKKRAREEINRADEYFEGIGVTSETPTRIPGNRRRP